ncbi:McbB family protein [Brevibacillus borstelensis]|uniref:McbB family protein n=1 Tax=Brevibacillus borstelensis TaxID=45462 RepID=UPI00203F6551|nr:McbB family protein [Brevibacillus borstelensis]MCM3560675.1 McbB family protein [Brevibacillus borstelensis]
MISNYRINKFLFHYLPNGELVVQTINGIMKIHNRELIDLILLWDKTDMKEISESFLEECFKDDKMQAIEFLETNGLISAVKEKKIKIDLITVMSNDSFIDEILLKTLSEDFKDKLSIKSIEINDLQQIGKNELSLVFLNPYNKNLGKMIRDRHLKADNSYLLMSYH